jgi:acetolactate synthase-1/2/3 large subunit
MRSYNPVRKGHGGQIRKAVQLLMAAKRPYIYTGGGVILGNATEELRTLATCWATLHQHADGPGRHLGHRPKFLGMLGMHGTIEANNAMQNCDVLLAVGARFDDRVIGNPKHFASSDRKIIHIDIDPSSISKRVKVDIPIVGDVKDVLADLIATISESGAKPTRLPWALVGDHRWLAQARLPEVRPQQQGSDQAAARGRNAVEHDQGRRTYITSDVGPAPDVGGAVLQVHEPRRWINSGGLGTMGVGIPYAMGIKLAKPDSEVYCITGEGSVQMCIQELSTCLQYNTPIKIVSLNNRYLGMVRQWQEIDYEGRYSHSYMDALPNFVKLAEAYGHVGMLIEHPRTSSRPARGAQAEGPHRVHGLPHRPDRERPSRW